jgi:hypothetical protein
VPSIDQRAENLEGRSGGDTFQFRLEPGTSSLLRPPVVVDTESEEADDTADDNGTEDRVHEKNRLNCHTLLFGFRPTSLNTRLRETS